MSAVQLIIFGFVLVRSVYCKEDPYFSESPKDVEVVQGKSVTLPCKVTPGMGMTYYWELNGSKIVNTTRRHQQGSNLHITRVDRERDSGQFTCIAEDSSTASAITSSGASLNIRWIDDVVVQLQEPESAAFITKGSDVTLRCHTDASGDVHYEWFRNADRLLKTDRIEIKKKKLHIKSVSPSDNGIYRCSANNTAGKRFSTVNFALSVAGDQSALIQVIPKDQIVPKGGTAYFDCQYLQAEVVQWYFKKDTRPLENNKKYNIYSNGTLQVNDVGSNDQGIYSCVGIRSESTEVPQTYTAELKLAYIKNFTSESFEPSFDDNSRQVAAAEGTLFQLTCLEPDSFPPAKKWWLNPSGHTVSDSGIVHVDADGRLIIDKVASIHAGNYTCVAENQAGKNEETVEVIVVSKPVISTHPSSITVDEDEQAVLTCDYEPKNRFTLVKWRKDGKSMKHEFNEATAERQRIRIFKHNATLLIREVEAMDRGEYQCEVLTKGFPPIVSQAATVSVIEKLKFVPPPVNKNLELGSVARVHCKAQGTPPPIITWKKDGEPLEYSSSRITSMNGTLIFNGVLNEDKGKYTCIASNSQGTINVTILIDVVVAPKFSVLPKNPIEVTEGQSVSIDCIVEGDPRPTIYWDRNLSMSNFDLTRFSVFENGTLYISEVQRGDESKYGCTAGNSAGLNRQEVQLIVHSRDNFFPEGDSTVTKAVLITMSVAGAYIILVIGLMVWCRYRRRSRKLPVTDAAKAENGDVEHAEIKEGANGRCSTSKATSNGIDTTKEGQKSDGAETTHSQSSNQSKKSKSSYDKLSLSRTNLKEMKLIGRGEFGDVMVAKISKSALITEKRNSQAITPTDDKELTVLVKALTYTKDENSLAEFKREIDMFTKLSHDNVTKLYGLCRENEPHYLILEHTDWGDLKQFLVATQKGTPPALTPVQCVAIIHQLCQGLDYLSSMRLIHKDIAARNCLVTSTLKAKIGLPRLTKEPYSQEYCKHLNQIIPLRWLPYEAVYEDEYSTKSDIYSFAVVIWEIFNQGELPFPKMNDTSFLNKLKEKKIEWKSHPATPEGIQKLQESCWDINPQNRPTFSELAKLIEDVLKSM